MTEPNLYIVRSLSSGFLSGLSRPYLDLRLPHLYVPRRFVAGPLLGVDVLPVDVAEIMLGRREKMPRRDFYLVADDYKTLKEHETGLNKGSLEVIMSGFAQMKDLKNLAEKLRTLHRTSESTVGYKTSDFLRAIYPRHRTSESTVGGIRTKAREEANEAIRHVIRNLNPTEQNHSGV